MTITTDFHSHVSYSSASAMAQGARKVGLRVLGLSEHVFQMSDARPVLPHLPHEGPDLAFSEYIESVRAASQQWEIDLRLGMEVDFIPERNAAIQEAIQPYAWDFLIGSVHEIDGKMFENAPVESKEHGEELWRQYFRLLRGAVSSGYYSLVSHPVRMRKANVHLPRTFDQDLEQLASEAAQQDIALEINGYDILHYPTIVRRLAQACASQHTPISVGSDAHRPSEIMRGHAATEALLHEVGITSIRTWKQRAIQEYAFD